MGRFHLVSPADVKQSIRDEWTFQRSRRDGPPPVDTRPTLLEWLRITWPDILTMLVMAGIALAFHSMWPPHHRLFSYTDAAGTLVAPDLAFPYVRPTISSAASGVLSIGGPIAIFVLAQFEIRHFWSLNNAVIGVLYANIGGTCFQVIIKGLIGGFRPHFLSVCQPDFSLPGANQGVQGIYHDWSICTGDRDSINNALKSFPSGHTEAAFAGFLYLSFWINANLKVIGPYQPRFWKIVLLLVPIMAAVLIAGDLQMTNNHHWYDIIFGALIGIVFAVIGYRSMFASIWDPETNDVPLHRKSTVTKSEERSRKSTSSRPTDAEMMV